MKQKMIEGTDVGFPVPISRDVWAANMVPLLPLEGTLMLMLVHDQGTPVWIGLERDNGRHITEHVVGFDLGAYGAMAERAMIDGRKATTMAQDMERVFVNAEHLPA